MKTILTPTIILLLVAGSYAVVTNYIMPLDLALGCDFLRIKPSTFYRLDRITKIEAVMTISTPIEGDEPLVQQYPLDDKIFQIV